MFGLCESPGGIAAVLQQLRTSAVRRDVGGELHTWHHPEPLTMYQALPQLLCLPSLLLGPLQQPWVVGRSITPVWMWWASHSSLVSGSLNGRTGLEGQDLSQLQVCTLPYHHSLERLHLCWHTDSQTAQVWVCCPHLQDQIMVSERL